MPPTFTDAELAAEEWRPVARDPRRWVSNLGRVWNRDTASRRGRIHFGARPSGGYCVVLLADGRAPVHVLVLEAFVGPCPSPAHEGAHGNGVRDDNRVSNLRWATRVENNHDRYRHGTAGLRFTPDDVRTIVARLNAGEAAPALAAEYGVRGETIRNIRRGGLWSAVTGITVNAKPCEACGRLRKLHSGRVCHGCWNRERRARLRMAKVA